MEVSVLFYQSSHDPKDNVKILVWVERGDVGMKKLEIVTISQEVEILKW